MRIGGIVLAGGRSRRMGVAKATLPFGPETLLERVVRIVGEVVSPMIVVAAAEQELPPIPADVLVVRDERPARGPLEGLRAGLRAANQLDAVYVSGCDTPLLKPAFIRRVIERLDDRHDAAVPWISDRAQPLSAAYRTDVLQHVDELLAGDCFRVLDLLDRIRVRRIAAEELRDVDPDLQSVRNLNTPADYEAALATAGTSS